MRNFFMGPPPTPEECGLTQAAPREQGPIDPGPRREGGVMLRGRFADGPIDTSTTAGKIAVMQAHAAGQSCERAARMWSANVATWCALGQGDINWNWEEYNYRIAPRKSALQRAREVQPRCAGTSEEGWVCLDNLVSEIDASERVIISSGGLLGTDGRQIKPGRYRMLRDDFP